MVAARCIEAAGARITSLRFDGTGDFVVVGRFRGQLAFEGFRPGDRVQAVEQAFVAKLGADFATRFVRPVDAPGAPRALIALPSGVGIITASPEPPEGPFLTRLDAAGNVTLRKDLGFGGLVEGGTTDASGAIVLRVQDGLRVVVVSPEGAVLRSLRIAPPWTPQFAASVTADAMVSDIALSPGGTYLVHARGPSEDGVLSDQALTKVDANGAVLWTRPVPVGTNASIVPYGAGVAVLTPRAGAICPGSMDRSFAVTALDGDGNVRWLRCFAVRAADLHLTTDTRGHVVVAGSMKDGDLGDGPRGASPHGVTSFVVRLGDRGESERIVRLGGAPIVALHGVTGEPGGGVVVAGAIGTKADEQTHLFFATLR